MRTTALVALVLSLSIASAATAAPTAEEKCQAAKLDALRKRSFCVQGELRNEILGKTPDTAKCTEKFDKAILMADRAAAKKGTSCRWLDNGDGTATDLHTGLQWEMKVDSPGSLHHWLNMYTWCAGNGAPDDEECIVESSPPDGTAFTDLLATLNGGPNGCTSADGSTTTGGFAGHCDWRLPTVGELRSMLDVACTTVPCTSIPGKALEIYHWSSSTAVGFFNMRAWIVNMRGGDFNFISKFRDFPVRAVRRLW